MNTLRNSLLLISLFCLFFSCTSSNKKEIVKAKALTTIISGPLGNYLEVVDNNYEVVDSWGANLAVKIKSKGKIPDSIAKLKDAGLVISLLGEDGMPLSGINELTIDYSTADKFKSLLENQSQEEVLKFKSAFGYDSQKDGDRVSKFSIASTLTDKVKETTSSEATTNSTSSSTDVTADGGSENWDKMMDDYEQYTDQYIEFWKKAQAGDQNAMSEYPALMEKSLKLSESMKAAQRDKKLSIEQLTRMSKIQMKMASAMTQK